MSVFDHPSFGPPVEIGRHLRGVLTNFPTIEGLGQCPERSVALVMDMADTRLAIGTFPATTPEQDEAYPEGKRPTFIHIWVEQGDRVFAPTLIERFDGLRSMDRDMYYASNNIQDIHYMKRADVLKFARDGHLAASFKFGRLHKFRDLFGWALLRRAGVPFEEVMGEGLVPPKVS